MPYRNKLTPARLLSQVKHNIKRSSSDGIKYKKRKQSVIESLNNNIDIFNTPLEQLPSQVIGRALQDRYFWRLKKSTFFGSFFTFNFSLFFTPVFSMFDKKFLKYFIV